MGIPMGIPMGMLHGLLPTAMSTAGSALLPALAAFPAASLGALQAEPRHGQGMACVGCHGASKDWNRDQGIVYSI